MNIMLCGASGFIGMHLAAALEARGYDVMRGVRDPVRCRREHPARNYVEVDFVRDTEPAMWINRLRHVDVVINAAGILREQGFQTFDALHARGPSALFEACARAGVRRIIQISALGADDHADTPYHLSKKVADDCLLHLPIRGVVLQPSLVFGPQGASTRFFAAMATLPITPLPGPGDQLIQPVHIDDLVAAVLNLVETNDHVGERIPVVGGMALSVRAYLTALRQSLGLGRARFVSIPKAFIRRIARWGNGREGALLDEDTWRRLERGDTADTAPLSLLLGRPPRSPDQFISAGERQPIRDVARLAWLLPLSRFSLAVVWLASGLVSMGLLRAQDSLIMLQRIGIGASFAPWMLYGMAAMDFFFGVATLAWPRRRLWLAQMALVSGYTAIVTVLLPEQWLHPLGPVVKNLPLLAALLMLYTFEERR